MEESLLNIQLKTNEFIKNEYIKKIKYIEFNFDHILHISGIKKEYKCDLHSRYIIPTKLTKKISRINVHSNVCKSSIWRFKRNNKREKNFTNNSSRGLEPFFYYRKSLDILKWPFKTELSYIYIFFFKVLVVGLEISLHRLIFKTNKYFI